MRRSLLGLCVSSLLVASLGAMASGNSSLPISKAPKDAAVYIVSPKSGATVTSPVTVVFGLKNMGVAPAGVKYPNSGHHHLIINAPLPKLGQPIPNDDKHRHFGKGQTQAKIELPPGKHTLQLILGDHLHIPHNPVVKSEPVTITVKK